MGVFFLLIDRLLVMLLFMVIGVVLFYKRILTEEGCEELGKMLIHLILPCVIIKGFLVERSEELMIGLWISIFLSVACLVISILIAKTFFSKNSISNFAAAFSNPGFFGLPLIVAVMGNESVFYVAPFIACLNILQWTYGVALINGKKIKINIKINIKDMIASPFIIGFIVGVILFTAQIPIPKVAMNVIESAANLNMPIAMLVSGVYLAKVDIRKMFREGSLYAVSVVRLMVIPAVCLVLFWLIPIGAVEMKMSLLLAVMCPVGSNVAVYAQLHNKDYGYAVQNVVLSTLLSMLTIPLWILVIQRFWSW